MAGLVKDLHTQFSPSFGSMAGLGAIDSIKKAYYDLETSNARAPALGVAGLAPRPILGATPYEAGAQTQGLPGMDQPGGQAPVDPSQIPDDQIAAAFDDPHERFAAFVAKYGDVPPPDVDKHFSLLDQLTMKE